MPIVDPVLRGRDGGRSLTIHPALGPAPGRDLADPAGLADLGPVDRVVLGLVDLGPVLQDLTGRAGRADRVDLDLVAPVGLVVRVDRGLLVGLEDLVVPAVQDPTDLAGRVDLAARVDRHRLRTGPKVPTIGVTRKWAARVTRRTASAHPTTVRRHRPGSMDSAGTADLLPEGLRLTGMVRCLRVAGTVLRLPVAGTLDGMDRHAT